MIILVLALISCVVNIVSHVKLLKYIKRLQRYAPRSLDYVKSKPFYIKWSVIELASFLLTILCSVTGCFLLMKELYLW